MYQQQQQQRQQAAQQAAQQQQQMQQGGMNWVRGGAAGRGRGRLPSWQQDGAGGPGPGERSFRPCGGLGVRWSAWT